MSIDLKTIFNDVKGEKRVDYPLSKLSSFRVGGAADMVLFPNDLDDLILICRIAAEKKIPLLLIGLGSNLLIRDGGVRGATVILRRGFKDISIAGKKIIAGAGVSLQELVKESVKRSLTGLEFMAGIPGTLGGAIAMNAGTNRGEIKDILGRITTLDDRGEILEINREDISFGYRMADLPEGSIVVEAELQLAKGNRDEIEESVKLEIDRRRKKGEYKGFNAGSIFKNPEGRFAGHLIEEAGLKGCSVGGVFVSPDHANFILNGGEAAAKDILELISLIKDKVYKNSGILLEEEIRIIGEG